MEEGLKLKISADLGQTIAALREMQREVAKTGAGAKGLGEGVTGASNKMPQLAKGTGQATAALTNFGRVASDAPFGLIGIANNIDPLIQSFVYLKKETGSAKGAFSALGQSLLGGGGLVLAVSLVTSAMQFASVGLSRWGVAAKKSKEATDEAKNAMDDFVRKTSEQKTNIEALVSVATNEAVSNERRAAAIKKLNDLIPDHIGILTKQNIATAEGVAIINKYIDAIVKQATAELLKNKIAENNVTILNKQNEQQELYLDYEKKIAQARKNLAAQTGISSVGGGVVGNNQTAVLLQLNNKINALIKERNDKLRENSNVIKDNIRQNNLYTDKINDLSIAFFDLDDGKGNGKGKGDKERKESLLAQNGIINSMRDNIEMLNELEEKRLQIQKDLLRLQLQQPQLKGSDNLTSLDQFNIRGLSGDKTKSSIDQLFLLSGEVKKLNKEFELTDELINTVGNEFANLFSNISKDGTKAFEDFAKAVAETTTRILINYAVTQALKALLNSMAPGAGMALDTKIGGEAVAGLTGSGGVLRGSDLNLLSYRATP
jgi:hypothetical protein